MTPRDSIRYGFKNLSEVLKEQSADFDKVKVTKWDVLDPRMLDMISANLLVLANQIECLASDIGAGVYHESYRGKPLHSSEDC